LVNRGRNAAEQEKPPRGVNTAEDYQEILKTLKLVVHFKNLLKTTGGPPCLIALHIALEDVAPQKGEDLLQVGVKQVGRHLVILL
jgi:hypothetical protein